MEIPNKPTEVKMPMVPAGSPMAGKSLNLGKLDSKDSQAAYLKKRRNVPFPIILLKYISILTLCVILGGYFWLKADLDTQNKYLKVAGVRENVYQEHSGFKKRNTILLAKTTQIQADIIKYEDKVENKEFYEQQDKINQIRTNQSIQWFDEILPGGELKLGVFDSFKKMEEYFASNDYQTTENEDGNGKVQGPQVLSRNKIEIENIVIDRNHASFSVKVSNLFGKIFFLSSEFVDMMNSFSFFKDGSIESFSRQTIDGTSGMSFTLDLKMQSPEEEDPFDERFTEYTEWESRILKKSRTTKTESSVSTDTASSTTNTPKRSGPKR